MVQKSASAGVTLMKKLNFLGFSCLLLLCTSFAFLFAHCALVSCNRTLTERIADLSEKAEQTEQENLTLRSDLVSRLKALGFEVQG